MNESLVSSSSLAQQTSILEPRDQVDISSNDLDIKKVSSDRHMHSDQEEEQIDLQQPSMGASESQTRFSQNPQELSDDFPAMKLQSTGSCVDPADTAPAGPSAVQDSVHAVHDERAGYEDDDDSTATVAQPRKKHKRPIDADFRLRGIPEGLDTCEDPEETMPKLVVLCPEERNVQYMPLAPQRNIASVNDCRECIGVLLDHTDNDMDIMMTKEQIIHMLRPDSFHSRLLTAYGLVRFCLPHKEQWQTDHLMKSACNHHETPVHKIIMELKAESMKLGHMVQFFSQECTKRLDIIKLIAKIHSSCDFCSAYFT